MNRIRISQVDLATDNSTTGQARISASAAEETGLSGFSRRGLISGAIAVAGALHQQSTNLIDIA